MMTQERKLLTLLTNLEQMIFPGLLDKTKLDMLQVDALIRAIRITAEEEMIVTEVNIDTPIREVPCVLGEERIFKQLEHTGKTNVTVTCRNHQNQYIVKSCELPTILPLDKNV